MASLTPTQVYLINVWTRDNEKARQSYYAQPISSPARPQRWVACLGGCGQEILVDAMARAGSCRTCRGKRMRARRPAAEDE